MRWPSTNAAALAALTVSLLGLTAPPAPAQTAVVTRNVNLRTGPSGTSAVIRLLEPPDELTILDPEKVNGYYEVRVAGGERGWVWARNVRATNGATATASPPARSGPPEIYRGCPLEGSAVQDHRKESNRQKNRVTLPEPADLNPAVTIAALLQDSDDATRWSDARAASIVVYVVEVKKGGEETVNCGERDIRYRDTHIDVVQSPDDRRKIVRVIVEVTPRWRAFMQQQGEDWSTPALKQRLQGRWVRFTGWLFWDFEHADEAEHSNAGGDRNWRATAWEIHPVTEIKVCPATPETCE
jgi:uncharacterized protein YgiM (DUF1202 family)